MKVIREEEAGALPLPPSRGVIMGCIGVGVCGRGDDMPLSVDSGLGNVECCTQSVDAWLCLGMYVSFM
jgi:hypothetical protein